MGSSDDPDSAAAGVAAATGATTKADPALYVVFAGHRHDHEALLAGVCSVAPTGAAVIGCTTGGEIGVGGPADDSVVVMAIGGGGLSVSTRCAEVVGGDLRAAGERAAAAAFAVEERGHTVLMLLSDGLAGDQREVVRGAYAAVGASIPLVGGCAGDGTRMAETVLFHADHSGCRIGGGQIVAAAISSVAPLAIGSGHGWIPVGEPVLITSSDGNVIHTIDDEPALDRYLRLHGKDPELACDPEEFGRFAATHPLAIVCHRREEVRSVSHADPETRSITLVAGVPKAALARVMEGTGKTVLDATEEACAAALAQLTGTPAGVLTFDCAARRGVMGEERTADEVSRIEECVDSPVAGFYGSGEFARVMGMSGFHNQTLVALAIG